LSARHAFVVVKGRRVGYRAAGEGPPVVLVAGLGLSSRFYTQNLDGFARSGLRLLVPDLPGFGETPGPRTGAGVEETAEFLAGFVKALNIRRAGWIGHSIGWQPAALLAARRPNLAAAVVAAAPTLPRGRRRALRQLAVFSVAASRESFDVYRAVARDYISTSPARYIGTWLRHARDTPLQYLPQVSCPFLIAIGTLDPMPSPADVTLMMERLPQASVVRIQGGSHGLPRDRPEEFNRVAVEFLRKALTERG
jgi:2-hydroxy-6-oxonona-2,4-dienedioate hydrolase